MTFALASQFHVYFLWGNSVLNVKVLVGTFNLEKALVGAFSMIVQLRRLIVYSSTWNPQTRRRAWSWRWGHHRPWVGQSWRPWAGCPSWGAAARGGSCSGGGGSSRS